MRKGTTPTHTFVLPFSVDMIAAARIVYAQNGAVLFVKTGDDLTMEGNKIETKLTQAETMVCHGDGYIEIQLRVRTTDGEVMASDIERVYVGRCLGDEVLV